MTSLPRLSILPQFNTASAKAWLHCSHMVSSEWHMRVTTRQMLLDLVPSHVFTVSQFLNQPNCNRLAKFLTWIRMLSLNRA